MKKSEFDALKAKFMEHVEKSTDMDTLINAIMKLPYGQLKKVLPEPVFAVLAKYGYVEEVDA